MRLAIFGASGRTGAELLRLAEGRGWPVRALVRPSAAWTPRAGVEVVVGDPRSPADVAGAMEGAEAVITVLGPRTARAEPFLVEATRGIVSGMQGQGLRRLVCLTGAMVGRLAPTVSSELRRLAALYRRAAPAQADDAAGAERVVMESGLDWTLVKPPRLTMGPPRGCVRAGPALRVGWLSRISRSDLAEFLLEETVAARYLRERVYVRG